VHQGRDQNTIHGRGDLLGKVLENGDYTTPQQAEGPTVDLILGPQPCDCKWSCEWSWLSSDVIRVLTVCLAKMYAKDRNFFIIRKLVGTRKCRKCAAITCIWTIAARTTEAQSEEINIFANFPKISSSLHKMNWSRQQELWKRHLWKQEQSLKKTVHHGGAVQCAPVPSVPVMSLPCHGRGDISIYFYQVNNEKDQIWARRLEMVT
jgi:hypothetical protein